MSDERTETCCSCRHWKWKGQDASDARDSADDKYVESYGECRRQPPVVFGRVIDKGTNLIAGHVVLLGGRYEYDPDTSLSNVGLTGWPTTMVYDWCGEHQGKQED